MVGYYPDARSGGIARMARVTAEKGSFLTTHTRYLSNAAPSGLLGQEEFIALALAYDVPLLLHHVPTNALSETPAALDMIDAANRNGGDDPWRGLPLCERLDVHGHRDPVARLAGAYGDGLRRSDLGGDR